MAWYYGVFSCGHEGRVNIIGPTSQRQWKADRKFEDCCPECRQKLIQEAKENKNKIALMKTAEMELPTLSGSEKQVAWATTLRVDLIEKLTKKLDELKFVMEKQDRRVVQSFRDELDALEIDRAEQKGIILDMIDYTDNIIDYMIENETTAKFYIDNRTSPTWVIVNIYFKIKEEEKKEEEFVEEVPNEIIVESTMKPEEVKFTGIVEVIANDNKISLKYEKNNTFINIVKSLGYKWEGIWQRTITEQSGSYVDRAAEVCNKLLNAGFIVMTIDEAVRGKAIKGDFEPECKRWIYTIKSGEYKGWLALRWTDDSEIYETVRRLPTSKWYNPYVVVKIERYKEVEEFAELYGFKFTQNTIKAIEQYKQLIDSIDTINPTKVEAIEPKDGLKEILNSSNNILDDLRDDD